LGKNTGPKYFCANGPLNIYAAPDKSSAPSYLPLTPKVPEKKRLLVTDFTPVELAKEKGETP